MRGQFEGALYSRARFNSTDHAAKPRHIVKLDRNIVITIHVVVIITLLNFELRR